MFKSWTIVDSSLSERNRGHNHWEAEAITQELLRRGTHVKILGHHSATPALYPGAEVHPLFTQSPYGDVPQQIKVQKSDYHNRVFGEVLRGTDRALFRDSLVLFPTVTHFQFRAILYWLSRFTPQERPKAAVVLDPMHKWPDWDSVVQFYQDVWTRSPDAVKEAIVLCARSNIVASHYEQLFGVRPYVLPCPNGPSENAAPAGVDAAAPMLVSYVGGSRVNRGSELLPELVRRCAPMPVEFFLHARSISLPEGMQIAKLHDPPRVQVHEGPLDRDAYHRVMARSVVLLPYDAKRYRWRFSGVYLEAICLGAPVIVSADTWMEDEVARYGNGVVIKEHDAASLADAVARAQQELASLRANAAALARVVQPQNGPAAYVDAISRIFSGAAS